MKRRAPVSFQLPSRPPIAPPRPDLRAAAASLRPRRRVVDRVLEAVAWPGSPPQGRLLPPGLVALAGVAIGPHAAGWQLAAWGVAPAGTLLKRAVRRPRPPTTLLPLPGSRGHGSGFPSTHVATYTGVYGFAAWLALRRSPFLLPLALVAAVPVALIGPSRVRAGDHWLSDVLAGYAFGAAWFGALAWLSSRDGGLRRELHPASAGAIEDEDPPVVRALPLPAVEDAAAEELARAVASRAGAAREAPDRESSAV